MLPNYDVLHGLVNKALTNYSKTTFGGRREGGKMIGGMKRLNERKDYIHPTFLRVYEVSQALHPPLEG